ncbi:MAG: DUF5333 family protein [Pseudomonadota bacterium]
MRVSRALALFLALVLAFMAAAPALAQTTAQDAELRPTPAYFAQAVFDLSMAQALARSCSTISVDPVKSAARAEDLLTELAEDGFDTGAPHEQMADPNAAIAALQTEFAAEYDLQSPSEEEVCGIAGEEMAAASGIGALLVEVAE